ncbi:MAG: PAS domain S-box protein [candidate division Zixibacteria bacterium]|nr:PAS domain S-box protein [candidate division Zixibacteria bacterium]
MKDEYKTKKQLIDELNNLRDLMAQRDPEENHKPDIQEESVIKNQPLPENVHFAAIWDNLPLGICITDKNGIYQYVNPAYCKIYGYSKDQLIGRPYYDLILQPDKIKSGFESYKKAFNSGLVEHFDEGNFLANSGETVWIQYTGVTIKEHGIAKYMVSMNLDITEQKQSQEALRESEEKYRAIVAAFDGQLLICSQDYKIEFMNRRYIEHIGFDATGQLCYKALHDRDDICPWCTEDRVFKGETIRREAQSAKNKRWYYEVNTPIYHVDGSVSKLALHLDITEQKNSQEALKESEEKYRAIVAAFDGQVLICSQDYKIEFMNQSFIEKLGYDATGKSCYKSLHDRDDVCPRCTGDRVFNGETIRREKQSAKDNNWYYMVDTPVYHVDGLVSKLSLQLDITKRKQAEKALMESEEKYRSVFESFVDLYFQTDMKGDITDLSPSCLAFSGYKSEELIGRNVTDIYVDQAEGFELAETLLREGSVNDYEINLLTKNGHKISVSHNSHIIYDKSGKPIRIEGTLRDITERKQTEEQLRQAQKMEAIGTLAGGIAHDFNNILAGIIGYTEIAMNNTEIDTPIHEYLQRVIEGGDRAKDLVQQILAFSRQSEQHQKPIQIKLIAEEALNLLRASLPSTIEIRHNIRSEAAVLTDPTQIHQVFMNLCTNAAHAMREKGGVLEVKLVDTELGPDFIAKHPGLTPGPYLKLSVSDAGHGMSRQTLDRIFDPFFTTKEKGEGTGMGLSVTHGIVKSCDGLITVYSELGEGTTFNIFLPTIERRFKSELRAEERIPTGTERILFIDDEKPIVEIGKLILESLGYDVVTKTDSLEALEFFKNQSDKIDLVITDMTMPKMTGEHLALEIKNIRSDIPIILCTGFSAIIDEARAEKTGIQAFVLKPILKKDIAGTVRRVLDKK